MSEHSFVERLGEVVQIHANARQVYGEPVERNGVTIIPVARVWWGFGGGGIGRGPAERGGGGGAAQALPMGFIEMRNGSVEFRPISSDWTRPALIAGAALLIGFFLGRR
jgi:uncharacterized spore protein YtfJ